MEPTQPVVPEQASRVPEARQVKWSRSRFLEKRVVTVAQRFGVEAMQQKERSVLEQLCLLNNLRHCCKCRVYSLQPHCKMPGQMGIPIPSLGPRNPKTRTLNCQSSPVSSGCCAGGLLLSASLSLDFDQGPIAGCMQPSAHYRLWRL